MPLPVLAQLLEGTLALFWGGEGDDAMRCPFVGPQDGRLGVLANEGDLLEMEVLEYVRMALVIH